MREGAPFSEVNVHGRFRSRGRSTHPHGLGHVFIAHQLSGRGVDGDVEVLWPRGSNSRRQKGWGIQAPTACNSSNWFGLHNSWHAESIPVLTTRVSHSRKVLKLTEEQ